MTDIELLDALTELSFRLECGASLLYALYDDMDRDAYPAAMFSPAIYAAYEYLSNILEEVRRLCDNHSSNK